LPLNLGQIQRYSRHLSLPEIGVEGQEAFLAAHAVLILAPSPGVDWLADAACRYLLAAGVGRVSAVGPEAQRFVVRFRESAPESAPSVDTRDTASGNPASPLAGAASVDELEHLVPSVVLQSGGCELSIVERCESLGVDFVSAAVSTANADDVSGCLDLVAFRFGSPAIAPLFTASSGQGERLRRFAEGIGQATSSTQLASLNASAVTAGTLAAAELLWCLAERAALEGLSQGQPHGSQSAPRSKDRTTDSSPNIAAIDRRQRPGIRHIRLDLARGFCAAKELLDEPSCE